MTLPSDPDFLLAPERLAVRVSGQEVILTSTQFRLLAVMMAEPGRTFSRTELLGRAFDAIVEQRTVDVHVKELRRKLGPAGERVQTIRGQGYRYRAVSPAGQPSQSGS
jgi:DNA-binding response OmpR family regulator